MFCLDVYFFLKCYCNFFLKAKRTFLLFVFCNLVCIIFFIIIFNLIVVPTQVTARHSALSCAHPSSQRRFSSTSLWSTKELDLHAVQRKDFWLVTDCYRRLPELCTCPCFIQVHHWPPSGWRVWRLLLYSARGLQCNWSGLGRRHDAILLLSDRAWRALRVYTGEATIQLSEDEADARDRRVRSTTRRNWGRPRSVPHVFRILGLRNVQHRQPHHGDRQKSRMVVMKDLVSP